MMIITAGISWLSLMFVLATLSAEQPHLIVSFHEVWYLLHSEQQRFGLVCETVQSAHLLLLAHTK